MNTRDDDRELGEPFETFDDDDLELIERPPMIDPDDDPNEAWCDPDELRREEEYRQWLKELIEMESFDPARRVVGLGPLFAAVFEEAELTLIRDDQHEWLPYFRSP